MEELEAGAELYGRIGQLKAVAGKREELIGYLLEGSAAMSGNLAYIVARDNADADAIWITEVWRDAAAHKASLDLAQVQGAIAKARPILAGFGVSAEITPINLGP